MASSFNVKKIDTSSIANLNYPSLLFIDKRNSKLNNNHFQLLNLDYASGFDILSQSDSQNESNQNTQQHFFHVSYAKNDLNITYRNSCICTSYTHIYDTKENLKVPVYIVFNYLMDYWPIEVNIVQMMNAIKQAGQLEHSANIINTMQFIAEHKLDGGTIDISK